MEQRRDDWGTEAAYLSPRVGHPHHGNGQICEFSESTQNAPLSGKSWKCQECPAHLLEHDLGALNKAPVRLAGGEPLTNI
jgi:hypothetical protein